jgi:hypothetical protein
MFEKCAPESVDTCHWTVGTGYPSAATLRVAVEPGVTTVSAGLVVTTGAWSMRIDTCWVAFGDATFVAVRVTVTVVPAAVAGDVPVNDAVPSPLSVRTSQAGCAPMVIAGAGNPPVVTAKLPEVPETNVVDVPLVKLGAFCTVSVAVVDAWPTPFEKTARYWWPASAVDAVKEYVVLVAPGTLTKVPPLLVRCH